MFAQALLEKGMLDSLATGFSNAFAGVQTSVDDHPWLWAALAVLLLFLLLRVRR
jgi:MYXO-CTERM domain-containing protein